MSRYERMRTDSANWWLGTIYRCKDDPRIVVRNLLPFGWTWNFAHDRVYLAIAVAIMAFPGLPCVAWFAGLRSPLALVVITAFALFVIVLVASRMARDPET